MSRPTPAAANATRTPNIYDLHKIEICRRDDISHRTPGVKTPLRRPIAPLYLRPFISRRIHGGRMTGKRNGVIWGLMILAAVVAPSAAATVPPFFMQLRLHADAG